MNWVTAKQAKAAAEKGLLPALISCLKHHKQGRDAPKDVLWKGIFTGKFGIDSDCCALCKLFLYSGFDSTPCPLSIGRDGEGDCVCCTEWDVLANTFDGFEYNQSSDNLQNFRDAEDVLCMRLEKEIDKVKGKSK